MFGWEIALAEKNAYRVQDLVPDGFDMMEMDAEDQDALKNPTGRRPMPRSSVLVKP